MVVSLIIVAPIVSVLWLFLTVPWVGLQSVIVVFPYHTHLLLVPGPCLECADPECFVREGFNFDNSFLVDKPQGSKYHYEWAIIGLPAKRN